MTIAIYYFNLSFTVTSLIILHECPFDSFLKMFAGSVNISKLLYSSDVSNKKLSGTTIKPEECVPESKYSKPQKEIPACELANGSCPPDCNKGQKQSSDDGGNKKYQFQYWHLLAALVVTGVAGYTVVYW